MTAHRCHQHRRYKITCAEWDALLSQAAGACMCCKSPTDKLLADHDHEFGQAAVRGLVCHLCNVRLAYVDSKERCAEPHEQRYLDQAWHLTHRQLERIVRPTYVLHDDDPLDPEPVSIGELMEILGVTRERVNQLRRKVDFPQPWVRLAQGPLWRAHEIEAWATKTGRTFTPYEPKVAPPGLI